MKANCIYCDKEIEVTMCCSGRECSCMGLPIDPLVCDKKGCWDRFKDSQCDVTKSDRYVVQENT